MKYRLIAVGKIREHYIAAAVADFRGRLQHYVSFDEMEIAASRGDHPALAVREEGQRILARIPPHDIVWLLDRDGKAFSSLELTERIAGVESMGATRLTFVIGGTHGADPALRERANVVWSLGPLTFLHEWARAIVLEQLYRAAKIAHNEPYHH
jgi:23S rRNA (pseudouridine1915-N3)-methyltransferase